jgi:CMP-N,N'-diacetyllegionaminic acid synthase
MINTVAVIPARAGSKRILNKNVCLFEGRPLLWYSIRAAQACPSLSHIVVSTDDPKAVDVAASLGVDVVERPTELATDKARTFDVLQHVYQYIREQKNLSPEFFVLLQPTSPLRVEGFIEEGLERMRQDLEASSLLSVYEERLFTGHMEEGYWVADYPEETRSQDIPPTYVPTGSLYIYRCSETLDKNDALGARILPFVCDADRVVNIDTKRDLHRLSLVYNEYHKDYEYFFKDTVPN